LAVVVIACGVPPKLLIVNPGPNIHSTPLARVPQGI
jgi:hypothetical protein